MESVQRTKFLTNLQSALDSSEVTVDTPFLTERFCLCLGQVKVTPQFTYTQVEQLRKEHLLVIFGGNEEHAGDHQFVCEVWVKKIIYLGLGTGRSKIAARNCAVQQVVRMLRPGTDVCGLGTNGFEYLSSWVMPDVTGKTSTCQKKKGEIISNKIRIIDINNNSDDDMEGDVLRSKCGTGGKRKKSKRNKKRKPVLEKTSPKQPMIDINNNSDDDIAGEGNGEVELLESSGLSFNTLGGEQIKSKGNKKRKPKTKCQIMFHFGPRMSKAGMADLIVKSVDKVKAVGILKISAKISKVAIEMFLERISNTEGSNSDYICTVFVEGEAIADAVGKLEYCKEKAAKLALIFLSCICTKVKVSTNEVNKEDIMSKAQFKAKARFLLNQELISPSNLGFQMLMMLGWSKGEGLGKDHLGRLEPVEPNGMKFFGEKPIVKIGDITEHEAEVVIKQYVIEDSFEDLSISTSDVTAAEVAVIKLESKKYSLSVKRVTCNHKGKRSSFLVISKSVEMSDIIEILKKREKSVVYQGTSKHLLVDSMPCHQVVLSNQHIRKTEGYPVQLVNVITEMKTGKQEKPKKHYRSECYQQLPHDYRDCSGVGGTVGTADHGITCTTIGMVIQHSLEYELAGLSIQAVKNTPQLEGLSTVKTTPQLAGLITQAVKNTPQLTELSTQAVKNTPQLAGLSTQTVKNTPQLEGLSTKAVKTTPQLAGLSTQAVLDGSLPRMKYPAGNSWKVFVTYVEYFDSLSVILVGELSVRYQDMEHKLNTWAQASCFLDTKTQLVVGRLYAAKVGQRWCRAKLVQDMGVNMVTCQLIDQGDYHMVSRTYLLYLPSQFTTLPAQAMAVSLHGMSRVPWQGWSVATANTVEDILQHHQLVATVTNRQYLDSITTTTKPMLVLTTTTQGHKVNVNQALVCLYGKTKPAPVSRLYNRPAIINPQHLPRLVYHTPLLLPSLPSVNDLMHLSIISDINHLGQFVMQLVQSLPYLHHLEQHMQRFYSMRYKEVEEGSEGFARGDFVAVKNLRRNLMWCRAMVLRVIKGGRMMIRFTDWGMSDIVPLADVQRLPRQFRNLPCLAMYCTMAGVKVLDRNVDLITDKKYLGQVAKLEGCKEQFQVRLELNLYAGREDFLGGKKLQDQLVLEGKAAYMETRKTLEYNEQEVLAA